MKRKIIAWCTVLAIVLGCVGLTFLLSGDKATNYGIGDGEISFTQVDTDITEFVIGGEDYPVAENENLTLSLDGRANPVIRQKNTGREWKAVPDSNEGNSKYDSALILNYFSDNSTKITMYSSENSVEKNQVRISALENGVKVEYGFGEMSASFVYPDIISDKRMEKFLAKMSDEDAEYVLRRYRLYKLEDYEDEDRTYLLSKYPKLKNENLYILTDVSTALMKKKTDGIFRKAGYTSNDRDEDNGSFISEKENPQTFKVSVCYTVTDTGFKATVNTEDCLFYRDYPLTEINILPYFDSFTDNDEGYFLLPSGCGALMKAGKGESEVNLSLPIYGNNISLTQQLEDVSKQCTMPVFGQYKNSSGYLCILNGGEQQAEIKVDRNTVASAASASFALIDSYAYSMSSSNPVQLFASDTTDNLFSAEYVLFDDMKKETAYSDMAVFYRNRLIENGVLKQKCHGSEALLLAEFVNVINYDTSALGFIPVNREYAVTTFEEVGEISKELSKSVGGENISVLLTGWNRKGLNCQKLGNINFSKAAGGENGYKALLNVLKSSNVKSYLDINFSATENKSGNGFTLSSQAARGINNSIVKLSLPDAQTNTYIKSAFSLISPKIYGQMWQSYSKNKLLSQSGLGVSGLTSMLYGDYSDNEVFSRKEALKEIINVLKSADRSEISIIGDAGNYYALPYLELVNNLSVNSSGVNAYYRDVPFVQTVLHGYVDYVAESVNGSDNIEKTVLKLIETGSGLHYILTKNAFDKLFETDYSYIYNTNYSYLKNEVQNTYATLSKALLGLNDKAITEHCYLSDDVVRITYENGVVIYVNYGNKDFVTDNITVPAIGYYRSNN